MAIAVRPKVNQHECLARFREVRAASVAMCEGLEAAEYRLQPIADVSPPWWNLGHTSWFFARNILEPIAKTWTAVDAQYDYLLNSYYAGLGQRLPRELRGSVSRPTTEEIYDYRASVDARVTAFIESATDEQLGAALPLLRIGCEHEQQHQELFYTEIKYILWHNAAGLRRAYAEQAPRTSLATSVPPLRYREFAGGLDTFGYVGGGWAWDNERPAHLAYLQPFAIADRLISCGEYLDFVRDGGYRRQSLWLDNGWRQKEAEGWSAPLYWEERDGQYVVFTLGGERPLMEEEPVCHLSFYEADAFARWRGEQFAAERGARLPREFEWEYAERTTLSPCGDEAFLDSGALHPGAVHGDAELAQMCGVLWQWTSSYYEPYPGYRPFEGVLAEYNGKFMDNQRVLRGGSCVTPRNHFRITYRNFWPGGTRFQFTGVRLAYDL